ncbi:hypothetical protein DGG96_14480 [Legionella qingyii]|uniref:Uncharacterized protein n=1 Tax=Legionella qingyii TaxID=2184757 RepID=A0A317U135_9GAMM|nr:hypothetical protein DGG96_14480 [Legionella qingyii]
MTVELHGLIIQTSRIGKKKVWQPLVDGFGHLQKHITLEQTLIVVETHGEIAIIHDGNYMNPFVRYEN